MKYTFPKLFSAIILTAVISMMIIGCLCSCTSTKEVNKTSLVKDSSAIKELQDSLHLLITEKTTLENKLKETEYATVEFDSTRCPVIWIPDCPAMLNKDSVQRLISELNNSINGLNNRIKTYADGSREISGKIKSATYSRDKEIQLRLQLEKEVDSLRNVKQKEKVVVKTEEKIVEKKKKTKFLTNIIPWIILGYVLRWKQKSIFKFLRR